MDENPYQSPESPPPVVGVLSGRREDLRSVAVYQKGLLWCILAYLIAGVASVAQAQGMLPDLAGIAVALLALVAVVAGVVFVFLLATKVYGVGGGIALAILTLIPCIGLVVLLIINGRATTILKKNGHHVGLLGADLSEF